jgi:hypothetical protein
MVTKNNQIELINFSLWGVSTLRKQSLCW